jgi:hypothetical protein
VRPDPLTAALREVTDTKRLLEALIISSESFDYPRAKATLQELNGKIRTLGKMQAELSGGQQVPSERVIPFPVPIRAGP